MTGATGTNGYHLSDADIYDEDPEPEETAAGSENKLEDEDELGTLGSSSPSQKSLHTHSVKAPVQAKPDIVTNLYRVRGTRTPMASSTASKSDSSALDKDVGPGDSLSTGSRASVTSLSKASATSLEQHANLD